MYSPDTNEGLSRPAMNTALWVTGGGACSPNRGTSSRQYRNKHRQYATPVDRLGLGHDKQRSIATTDVSFTAGQWIFLQIFRAGTTRRVIKQKTRRETKNGQQWSEMGEVEQRRELDEWRLAIWEKRH